MGVNSLFIFIGKTLQVIAFFSCLFQRHNIFGPHLVIMPLSVLSSWKGDIAKYCPTIEYYVHLGSKEEREANCREWFSNLRSMQSPTEIHICLTTYDMVLKDKSLLAQLSRKRLSKKTSCPPISWSYIVVSLDDLMIFTICRLMKHIA